MTTGGDSTVSDAESSTGGELWCETGFDPSVVYMAGSYSRFTTSTGAVARIDAPSAGCLGFHGHTYSFCVRPTDGKLLFIDTFDYTGIHVFAPDPNTYPYYDNDEVIPTTPCGDDGPRSFVVHPVDGTVVYNCDNHDSGTYYDADGDIVLAEYQGDPIALGTDGTFLTVNGGLFMVSPQSAPIPLEPPDILGEVIATRAYDGGFWIAHQTDNSAPVRAFVDSTGHVTNEGEYAVTVGPPQPIGTAALSGDGDLVHVRYEGNMPLLLIRSQLLPGVATVIYDGVDFPEDGSFLYVTALFTGP